MYIFLLYTCDIPMVKNFTDYTRCLKFYSMKQNNILRGCKIRPYQKIQEIRSRESVTIVYSFGNFRFSPIEL